MDNWADDNGISDWARATCTNEECGYRQDVRVVTQYGCTQMEREECSECGAPLALEGE